MTLEDPIVVNNDPEVLFEGNNWTLKTSLEAIGQADNAFEEKLKEKNGNSEEIADIWLGFHEALVNSVVHGNLGIIKPDNSTQEISELVEEELERLKKSDPEKKRNRKVHMTVKVNKNRIYVKIRDEGEGFKHIEVIDPTNKDNLLKSKGRGRFLMEKAFNVTYNKKGNEVTLVKNRKNN